MNLSVPGVPASCEKFPHSSQLNFWSTESIFNQFSVLLKTLNALCVCLQYKHPRSMKGVIRSDNPVTLLLLFWSHKCDFATEPRSHIIATSAVKGLKKNPIDAFFLFFFFFIKEVSLGSTIIRKTSINSSSVRLYWPRKVHILTCNQREGREPHETGALSFLAYVPLRVT
jgi:hypothetical protein